VADNDDFLEEAEKEESDPEAFNRGRALVKKRCDAAGIKAEEVEGFEDGTIWLTIEIPAGRSTTCLLLDDEADTNALLSIEFEKYRMLSDYTGICSYADGMIEAGIRPISMIGPSSYLLRRLFGTDDGRETNIEPIVLQQGDAEALLTITIGTPSAEFQVFDSIRKSPRSRFSVRIANSKAQTHDKALRTLERLANAVFFQIDLQMGIPLGLQREQPHRMGSRRVRPNGKRHDLTFPGREYDPQPMSLYWYAKSARGIPLLQYLAFYQVLEFYMPTYSNHEAIVRVRNILKDPRFTPDKDPQIARVLAALRPSARGFGDERSQLEAVLRRCVSPDELREFYTSDENRVAFYKDGFKSVAPQKIPLGNETSDLLTETAQRLYEIRCRIVHTKDHADRDLQPLLPYSKEAGDLYEDIALSEFIATSVLVASSVAMPET
jgi:hypothetical protein